MTNGPKTDDTMQATKPPRRKTSLDPERRIARNWYWWLWLSPLLTVPTLLILILFFWAPLHGHGPSEHLERTEMAIAVLGSALWHLILLRPARNKESEFVCWHGRQALLLAGVRTAVPLSLALLFGSFWGTMAFIPAQMALWFFGTLFGQLEAARGDCSLMRWLGHGQRLAALQHAEGRAQAEDLVKTVRYSRDPELRRQALTQLEQMGMVEGVEPTTEAASTAGPPMPAQTPHPSTARRGLSRAAKWFMASMVLVFFIASGGLFALTVPGYKAHTARTHERKGNYYLFGEAKYEKAAAAYRKALALDPDLPYALNNLAWTLAYHLDTDYEEALGYALRAVAQNPKSATYDTLALVYYKLENYEAALTYYDLSLSHNSKSVYSHKGRGDVYRALGNKESALKDYWTYQTLASNDHRDWITVEDAIRSLQED